MFNQLFVHFQDFLQEFLKFKKVLANKPKLISYGAKNVIPFLTPYGAKTGSVLAPYGAKTGNPVWHHMVLTTY